MRYALPRFFAVLSLVSAVFAPGAEAQWFQRRTITVTSSLGSPGSDVPVPVVLDAGFDYGNAQAAGEDVRFATTPDAHTTLAFDVPHFVETWNLAGASLLWVKVPSVPASGTTSVYMFYANPSATSASSLADTFPSRYVSTDLDTVTGTVAYDWFEVQAGHTVSVTAGSPVSITARRVKIAGTLTALGRGYQPPGINTAGTGPGGGGTSTNSGCGGGSYGGVGGTGGMDAGDTPGTGGPAYGLPDDDAIAMGSSGGSGTGASLGGAGGGAVSITAQRLDVSGTIDADGGASTSDGTGRGGGGGAGGGILLHAYDLVLSGTLSARGGIGAAGTSAANDSGGGGGGGRIKLLAESSLGNTGVTATTGGVGGPNGTASPGQPGTEGSLFSGTGDYDYPQVVSTVGPADTLPVELFSFSVE